MKGVGRESRSPHVHFQKLENNVLILRLSSGEISHLK